MKILVTGGGGYAGSNIVFDLLKHNHRVIAVDNLSKGIAGIQAIPNSVRFQFVEADMLDWKPP